MCGRIDEFDPVSDPIDVRPYEGGAVRHCGRDWRFLPEERGFHSFIAQDSRNYDSSGHRPPWDPSQIRDGRIPCTGGMDEGYHGD